MKKKTSRGMQVSCLISFCVFTSVLAAANNYQLLKKIPIPGDGGWDYVASDSDARRLYVSHDTEIVVIDLDSGTTIGRIPGGESTHGAAIATEFGRGFISASDPGSVSIFNLVTLAVIGKVKVGDDPNGIIYDQKTKRIFTADRGSHRVSAIDARDGKIIGSIDNLAGKTEHLASDSAGHIFLNIQDRNTLLKIDAQALTVMESWSTEPCEGPTSMDMDRANHRIFIGCRSGLMIVVNSETGKIVATQPIGPGVDATEYDAYRGLIYYSTGGDGSLSIFHEDTPDQFSLVEHATTQAGARTMALDHKTGRVYLAVADLGPRPPPTPEEPHPRPSVVPGTFCVLEMGR